MHRIPSPVFDVRQLAEKYKMHHGISLTAMYSGVTRSRTVVLPKEKYRKIPMWTTPDEICDDVVVYSASDAWATGAIFEQLLTDKVYVLPSGPHQKTVQTTLPNSVLQKIQESILEF